MNTPLGIMTILIFFENDNANLKSLYLTIFNWIHLKTTVKLNTPLPPQNYINVVVFVKNKFFLDIVVDIGLLMSWT